MKTKKSHSDEYDVICYGRFLFSTDKSIQKEPSKFYKFINYKCKVSSYPSSVLLNNDVISNPK